VKPATVLKLALAAALVLLVTLVQVVKSIDVDRFHLQASRWITQQTGRTVTFAGPLSLKLGLRPALVTDGVTLANRAGSALPDMVKLGHVEAQIGLLPLLLGEVRVTRIRVDGADIALDSDGHGQGNWNFIAGPVARDPAILPASAIRITQIIVERVTVHLSGTTQGTLQIDHATLDSDGPAAPIALTLEGNWQGRHLTVSGLLSSLKDMLSPDKPLSLRLTALLPGLVISLDGTLSGHLLPGPTLQMAVNLDSADSADLGPWVGLKLPSLGSARAVLHLDGLLEHPRLATIDATIGRHDELAISVKGAIADPLDGSGVDLAWSIDGDAAAGLSLGVRAGSLPLSLSGHISSSGRGGEQEWRIADLKGSLGRSDMSGQLSLQNHAGRPRWEGHFDSVLLDLTRPGGALLDVADSPPEARFFSDLPLVLGWLTNSDGHVSWQIKSLILRRLDGSNLSVDLAWQGAKFAGTAKAASIAGGTIDARVSLDAAGTPTILALDMALSHLGVGDLLSALALSDALAGGQIDFRLHSRTVGDTPRTLFASLQGDAALAVGSTTINNRLGQDGLGKVIGILSPTGNADSSDLRCLVSFFTFIDGLARSEALLFNLAGLTVTGQGSVNLQNEMLDFTVTPRPAGVAAGGALDIGGSLLHPIVTPDKGAIVRNLPAISGDLGQPLQKLASMGANSCLSTLLQTKRGRTGGGATR
jgi:hypothetical protein